jgi:GTPase SAR1 family protein/uncharacterized membrane protein
MALAHHSFEDFARLRDRLLAVLDGVRKVFDELNEPERAGAQGDAMRRLVENRFKIVMLGEMKLGKSTLINALLGEKLVPSQFGLACTAIPISIRWGDQRLARCFRPSTDQPDEIDIVRDAAKFWQAVTIPPADRRVGPADDESAFNTHPFTHAEVEAPLKLLEQGAELQDAAGTHENVDRTRATWGEIDQSGAVIVLFSCAQVGKESDRQTLRAVSLKGLDPRVVFVVWNYYDMCRKDTDASELVRREAHAMAARLGVPHDHICFVSASEGLEAKLKGDSELLDASGLPALERSLGGFLMSELAAAKLLTPLGIAERAVNEALQDVLSNRIAAWSTPPKKSEEAAREAAELVQHVDRTVDELSTRMRRTRDRLPREVKALAGELIVELCGGAGQVVQRISVSSKEAVFHGADTARRLVREVDEWTEQRITNWERKRLRPVIDEFSTELGEDTMRSAAELQRVAKRVQELHQHVRATQGRDVSDLATTEVGGELDPAGTSGLMGGSKMAGELLSGISFTAGVGSAALVGSLVGGLVALVLLAPVLPFAVIAAVVWAAIRGMSAAEMLKDRVAKAVISEMEKRAVALEALVVDEVRKSAKSAVASVESQFKVLRDEIRAWADQIYLAHAENERLAAERMAIASRLRSRLQALADEIDVIGFEIDPARNAERLADRVARRVRAEASGSDARPVSEPVSSAPTGPTLSVSEMELKMDTNALGRLSDVEVCLKLHRRWTSKSREQILSAWCRLPKMSEQALVQVPVFRTVTAMATSVGEDGLPFPEEVRGWWKDDILRVALLDLYAAIAQERHTYEAETTPGRQREKQGLFVLAYTRARKAVLELEQSGSGSTAGSTA